MNDDRRKPTEYDAVLGVNNPTPVEDCLDLEGIAGIKQRLESDNPEIVKGALSDAIAYQEEGLNLVIAALSDHSQEIRQHAVKLLRQQKTAKAEQALLDYDPRSLFTLFDNWNLKDFELDTYLEDSVNTAYRIDLEKFNSIVSELKKIEPQGSKIEALHFPMWYGYGSWTPDSMSYKECIDLLLDAHDQLVNLKALYFADETDDRGEKRWEYKRYKIWMDEVSYLLEAYPKLEVLHLLGNNGLEFSRIQHNNLKTLIIEARILDSESWEQILNLDLPQLEYLELWIGCDREYFWQKERGEESKYNTSPLIPLLNKNCFPSLKYLGICGCEGADDVVDFLQNSPVLDRLRILNLSRGSLTDRGAKILLENSKFKQLHTIDISMNILSSEMVNSLSKKSLNLIFDPQDRARDDICGSSRYSSVYE